MAMDIDTWINRIGSVVTILAALFSWYQAYRAKRMKDEIKESKIKNAVIDLIPKAVFARSAAQKLVSVSGKQSRGFNPDNSLKTIQQFVEMLNDTKHLFENENSKQLLLKLKNALNKYQNESDSSKKEKSVKSIYDTLNDVIAELNKCRDEKI